MSTAQQPQRVLEAPPQLGLATREAFRLEANAILDGMAVGEGVLLVDLSGTREIDSAGLGALVLVQRHASERRLPVVLRGVGQEIEYLLVLTKLDDLFGFEPAARP